MTRYIAALVATAATVSLAACGSSDAGPDAAVKADAAKTRIEQAAHVKLAAETVPADAREQGLQASYSNAATTTPSTDRPSRRRAGRGRSQATAPGRARRRVYPSPWWSWLSPPSSPPNVPSGPAGSGRVSLPGTGLPRTPLTVSVE